MSEPRYGLKRYGTGDFFVLYGCRKAAIFVSWPRESQKKNSGSTSPSPATLVPILSRFRSNFVSNLLKIRTLALFCGKTGIRTLEPFLTTTRFPDVPLQPLEHLSSRAATETGLSAGANIRIKSLKFQLYFSSCPGQAAPPRLRAMRA